MHALERGATELHSGSADDLPALRPREYQCKTRTWAPSVNVPYGVSELGAPGGYTAVLAA